MISFNLWYHFFSGELANIEEESIKTMNSEEKKPEQAEHPSLSVKDSNQSSQSKSNV